MLCQELSCNEVFYNKFIFTWLNLFLEPVSMTMFYQKLFYNVACYGVLHCSWVQKVYCCAWHSNNVNLCAVFLADLCDGYPGENYLVFLFKFEWRQPACFVMLSCILNLNLWPQGWHFTPGLSSSLSLSNMKFHALKPSAH